jgi:hypothetical protein
MTVHGQREREKERKKKDCMTQFGYENSLLRTKFQTRYLTDKIGFSALTNNPEIRRTTSAVI